MKIAILGATGKAGALILKEAKSRGIDSTAIVRDRKKMSDDTPVMEKSVDELTVDDVKQFDVLVSALGFWQNLDLFITSTQHLIDILAGQKTRLLVVGGAGSLYVNPEHTLQLKDTPDFPADYKPLAEKMSEGLELLKASKDVNWTYISPAAFFDAQGKRTGSYQLAGEQMMTDTQGKSYISYADYAIAMVDEIEKNAHPNQRISVYHVA